MQRNLRLTVAYDGTAYHGWQVQPTCPTVQGELERCLRQLTQQPCRVRGAGRTDAGVHARGQLANVCCETALACDTLLRGLNALLPADIVVRAVDDVPLSFDSRRDNRGKHYRYSVYNGRWPIGSMQRQALQQRAALDLPAMAAAGWQLVGTHDFSAFRAADCDRENTVRTIFRCSIRRQDELVAIDVEGTAFLKQMVRIIAGTLIEVGLGRRAPATIDQLLHCGDRTRAGFTAPAHGLCLVEVFGT